jgi:hypothetical protein
MYLEIKKRSNQLFWRSNIDLGGSLSEKQTEISYNPITPTEQEQSRHNFSDATSINRGTQKLVRKLMERT